MFLRFEGAFITASRVMPYVKDGVQKNGFCTARIFNLSDLRSATPKGDVINCYITQELYEQVRSYPLFCEVSFSGNLRENGTWSDVSIALVSNTPQINVLGRNVPSIPPAPPITSSVYANTSQSSGITPK